MGGDPGGSGPSPDQASSFDDPKRPGAGDPGKGGPSGPVACGSRRARGCHREGRGDNLTVTMNGMLGAGPRRLCARPAEAA